MAIVDTLAKVQSYMCKHIILQFFGILRLSVPFIFPNVHHNIISNEIPDAYYATLIQKNILNHITLFILEDLQCHIHVFNK